MNEEEKKRIFMRLCPYRRSDFTNFFKKIKEMSSITNGSFNLESHTELNLFISMLNKHMKKEYEERSIIINGESFSDKESLKKKINEIKKKDRNLITKQEKLFVREFIRYHPKLIKIKNDLYRETKKYGRKKIVGPAFHEGDIYLRLEGVKELEKFSKEKIYKAIENKKIHLKGSVPFTIKQTVDDKVPKVYEISLTDCNNFLINFLKEHYKDYKNPKRIVYGNLDKSDTCLLVQDVYGNFVKLKPLKDIFDKDNSKYCQGYLILNERGNWTCSFCKNVVVNNNIEDIVYPTYDKKKAGLQDSSKVSEIKKPSITSWKNNKTKKLAKALKEAMEHGPEAIKKAANDLKKWNSKSRQKKKKEYDKLYNAIPKK